MPEPNRRRRQEGDFMMRPRVFLLALAFVAHAPVWAVDYGQQGAVFQITEPDLLSTIERKLKTLEVTGGIDRVNQELARRTEAKIRRPEPVVGLGLAVRDRRWTYDPTTSVADDIVDQKGRIIAQAGRRVNPLDYVALRQALVFIDGDVEEQVQWALKTYPGDTAKVILVRGAPLDLMTRYRRRLYFDQGGFLVRRFGIRAVPAVAAQEGKVLTLREVPVGIGRR